MEVANKRPLRVTEATRVPMSTPEQNLKVPELDGYHLHWHLESNVPRALAAGYEFVDPKDAIVAEKGVANSMENSGSTDLGSKISLLANKYSHGDGSRLYLMKLREDWWEADQKKHLETSEKIASAMRAGLIGAESDPDIAKRKLKAGQDLFIPKHR